MYKTMANFFNDKFTNEEEIFIQKIIQTFEGFKNSNYFHSQLSKAVDSKRDGAVGCLIELIIKNEFFKQNPDYDKNLSSEPYLKYILPKIDLKYHNNNLQIKTINLNCLIKRHPIKLIGEKFNIKFKTSHSINLILTNTQQQYHSFFEKRITLTLFIIYEFKNDVFNFRYFFLTKNKLTELFFLKNNKKMNKQQRRQINIYHYNQPSIQFLKLTVKKLKTIKPIKIKIDKNKTYNFQNELKFKLNLEYLKTIQQILNSQKFLQEFFNLIENPIQNYCTGLNGHLIETLFTKHLNENKYLKNLLLNQSCIKKITNIPIDFIIDDNFYQLKTIDLNIGRFKFKLFQDSNFLADNTIEEKIQFYNLRIANTLILAYCKKTKMIIPYFLTFNDLFIKSKHQCKNENNIFNFNLSNEITVTIIFNKTILIEISKKHQQHEQYLLSNQIKKLEQQNVKKLNLPILFKPRKISSLIF